MTREQAIAHGKEQLEIFGGEHREFIEMAIKALEQEPITKNDLGVDLIDREKAIEGVWEIELAGLDNKKVVDMLKDLPSVIIKNDLAVDCTINGLDDFIAFGKKAFGVELTVKKSDNPDTYAKLFGNTKNDLGVDCISRQDVLSEIIRFSTEEGSSVECQQLYCDVNNMPTVTPQEPILDKLRAEIKEWYWQADKQALAKDPCVVDAMIDLFIRTIDKYKAESEDT